MLKWMTSKSNYSPWIKISIVISAGHITNSSAILPAGSVLIWEALMIFRLMFYEVTWQITVWQSFFEDGSAKITLTTIFTNSDFIYNLIQNTKNSYGVGTNLQGFQRRKISAAAVAAHTFPPTKGYVCSPPIQKKQNKKRLVWNMTRFK